MSQVHHGSHDDHWRSEGSGKALRHQPEERCQGKKRSSVADLPAGPQGPLRCSSGNETIIIAFRKHTLLPLDSYLYALHPMVPHLSRSSLHRCLRQHGIKRLPEIEDNKPAKKEFKAYPIGFFHIDAEAQMAEVKLLLFGEIDQWPSSPMPNSIERLARWSLSNSCAI